MGWMCWMSNIRGLCLGGGSPEQLPTPFRNAVATRGNNWHEHERTWQPKDGQQLSQKRLDKTIFPCRAIILIASWTPDSGSPKTWSHPLFPPHISYQNSLRFLFLFSNTLKAFIHSTTNHRQHKSRVAKTDH